MELRKFVIVIIALFLLGGCAETAELQRPWERGAHIQDADPASMTRCQYLGQVEGFSFVGGIGSSGPGYELAKNSARRHADSLGASHVVWGTYSGGPHSSISGHAYRCGGTLKQKSLEKPKYY